MATIFEELAAGGSTASVDVPGPQLRLQGALGGSFKGALNEGANIKTSKVFGL